MKTPEEAAGIIITQTLAGHIMDGCATKAEISDVAAIIRDTVVNTPEIVDFVKAVQIEAIHQRERWDSEHDAGKTPADWFWLLGFLAGKALHSLAKGDTEKGLHHIITTAAACANWHAQITGKSIMRPGLSEEKTKGIEI